MRKIFFGWFIVAVTMVLMVYNSAMFIYGFTVFMEPIAATFGWGVAQVSLAQSLRGLETGALDPFIGVAADRWKAQRLIFIGLVILALGIICVGLSVNIVMFFGGFLLIGLGSAMGISMVPQTVIARWFRKDIGKASGILAAGVALGGVFAPALVQGIDAFGWRYLMIYMAVGMLILGLPMSFVFRNKPEEYGLVPDGRIQSDDLPGGVTHDYSMERKEAIKTRAFWFIGISMLFQMGAMNSVALHQVVYITSIGIERPSAAAAVSIFSIVGLVARLSYGVLADLFPKKFVLAGSNVIITVGLLLLGLLDGTSYTPVVIYAVIYGIGAGGASPLRTPIIRDYFGTKYFGAISGIMLIFPMLGGFSMSPLTGWVYDTRGVYDPIWFVYASLTAIGAILLLLLPRPFASQKKNAVKIISQ